MIAALYVQTGGVYFGLPNVDPYDEARDARTYAGPWPVVAHPPCERWGRYWSGGPSARVRRVKGDDGGCFAAALAAVRRWGGVLEHPEASSAWSAHRLLPPWWTGTWSEAGDGIGWTCCVSQGKYGHPARKMTWLYACGVADLPELPWGAPPPRSRLDDGFHSKQEATFVRASAGYVPRKRLTKAQNAATPIEFRDLLISIASMAGEKGGAA